MAVGIMTIRVVYLADKNTGREDYSSRPSRPDRDNKPGKRAADYDDLAGMVEKHLGVKPDLTLEQPASPCNPFTGG
jgi:hypothetical protein